MPPSDPLDLSTTCSDDDPENALPHVEERRRTRAGGSQSSNHNNSSSSSSSSSSNNNNNNHNSFSSETVLPDHSHHSRTTNLDDGDNGRDGIWAFSLGAWWALGGRGIPLRLHYTYLLLVVIQVVIAKVSYADPKFTVLVLLIYGPVLFVTTVVHEAGHAWVTTRWLKGQVDSIVVWPLGGFAICRRPTPGGISDDMWVALAGPATHLPQFAFWMVLYAVLTGGDFTSFSPAIDIDDVRDRGIEAYLTVLAEQAMVLNAGLATLNAAVPAYPLDGGQFLAALLVWAGWSVNAAAYLMSVISTILGTTFVYSGIFLFITGRDEEMGQGLMLVILALYIIRSSLDLLRCTLHGNVSDHPLYCRDCYHHHRRRRTGRTYPHSQNNGNKRGRGRGGKNAANRPPSPSSLRQWRTAASRTREDSSSSSSSSAQAAAPNVTAAPSRSSTTRKTTIITKGSNKKDTHKISSPSLPLPSTMATKAEAESREGLEIQKAIQASLQVV